jgi:hypothetical protein
MTFQMSAAKHSGRWVSLCLAKKSLMTRRTMFRNLSIPFLAWSSCLAARRERSWRGSIPMSSAGRAASSSGSAIGPEALEIGLHGCAVPIQHSSRIGSYVMATAEHREPCESRGSRTVLGARGGEIPPRDSTAFTPRAAQKADIHALRIWDPSKTSRPFDPSALGHLPLAAAADQRIWSRNWRVRGSRGLAKNSLGGPCSTRIPLSVK